MSGGCSGIPFFTVLMTVYRVTQRQATKSLYCHLKLPSTKYKLRWCTYDWLNDDKHFNPDVIIMYFNKKMVEKGTFEFIIRVKGMLGNTIPILALIENGTKQDIFSILKAGVYDYLENVEDLQEYQKKIEEILLWVWYLKKYGSQKGCNDQ